MSKATGILIGIIIALILIIILFFAATPSGKAAWNSWFFNVQKADDDTNYQTIKQVEDTCRAMISSYDADVAMWKQYHLSEDKDEQIWAKEAMVRANRTASNYNNYILKNTFIWKGNVPIDIRMELPLIEG